MLVVAKSAPPLLAHAVVEGGLADVAERRVAEVVPERDRLREVLVQPERPSDVAGDPARLERVRQPRAVVVALRGDEHLRLVLEAAKRLRVDDPVAVAHERRAVVGIGLGLVPVSRVRGRGKLGQRLALEPLYPPLNEVRRAAGPLSGDSVTEKA